jgi:hypothetical protein
MIAERLSELRESAARMSQALARHPALARSLAANAIEWPLRAAE